MHLFRPHLIGTLLGMTAHLALAQSPRDLLTSPADSASKHLAEIYKISNAEALVLANTLIKGTELVLEQKIPSTQADLEKVLRLPRNEPLRVAFDGVYEKRLHDIPEKALGRLANEIAALVDSKRHDLDVARSCGISETLFQRFGLRLSIPLEAENPTTRLRDVPTNLNVLLRDLEAFNKRGVIRGASKTELQKRLREGAETLRLSKNDLRKAHFALNSLDGSKGPTAKSAAQAFIAMSDAQIFSVNRMALTIVDFLDEGTEGEATLSELAAVTKKINSTHKTGPDRSLSLCQHLAQTARGNPSKEARFRKFQRCPNYQNVFTACSP